MICDEAIKARDEEIASLRFRLQASEETRDEYERSFKAACATIDRLRAGRSLLEREVLRLREERDCARAYKPPSPAPHPGDGKVCGECQLWDDGEPWGLPACSQTFVTMATHACTRKTEFRPKEVEP